MGEIKRKDDSIAFKTADGWRYVPVEGVRELYFMNEVSLNSKFLNFCGRVGIVLHFFSYSGRYGGTFFPKKRYISGELIIKQVEAFQNRRVELARRFVLGIIRNLYEVVYHYYRHGRKGVKPFIDFLKEAEGWAEKAPNLNHLLQIEGGVWNRFYSTFNQFLPPQFAMEKRVKRPPDTPINALISFGNSLLYAKTVTALYQTHLEQSISYLHAPQEGRFSLSLDLSEPFKPVIVFRTIFELINRRQLRIEDHFDKGVNYALLNEEGRKLFIRKFEERLQEKFYHPRLKRKISYQTALKLEGYKLIKNLMEGAPFRAFSLKEKV
jgi:CRISPR-associated protein Cas1